MNDSRILRSALIVAAGALALSGFVDGTSKSIAERYFARALVTFAAARTLNGVISAAQGTEVALEPGGVGVILSIGEALDPINDLVEQFSSIMLIAASSLGLQNILLQISAWWGLNAVLVALGAVSIVTMWAGAGSNGRLSGIASRLFLIALFIRFAVPMLVLATSVVSDVFLAEEIETSTAVLERTSAEIEEINEADADTVPDGAEPGMLDRLSAMLDDSIRSLNATERLQRLKHTASNAAEHIVNLIVIFLLQTIILPLAILWVLLEIVKGFISRMAQGTPDR